MWSPDTTEKKGTETKSNMSKISKFIVYEKTATTFLFCIFVGRFVFSHTTFNGKLDLSDKVKMFSVISANNTNSVSFNTKDIDFNASRNFLLIRIKNKEYNLVVAGDSIKLTESKSAIEYSIRLKLYISTKKSHQLVLAVEKGNIVLDAIYKLKGNTANFEIKISEKKCETELLAYATKYLYELSLNEVNTLIPYYFFMYLIPSHNTQYSQQGFRWYAKACSPLQLFVYLDREKVRNPATMAIPGTLAVMPKKKRI